MLGALSDWMVHRPFGVLDINLICLPLLFKQEGLGSAARCRFPSQLHCYRSRRLVLRGNARSSLGFERATL